MNKIRLATLHDAAIISQISSESWKYENRNHISGDFSDGMKSNHWEYKFKNGIATGKIRCYLVYEEEEPVGTISFGDPSDTKYPNYCEIFSLYILPKRIGNGYGTMLMNKALSDIFLAGFDGCYLWVLSDNDYARVFYETLGFKPDGESCVMELDENDLVNVRYSLKLNHDV